MRFIYNKIFIWVFSCLCALVFLVFLNSRGGLDSLKKFFLRLPAPAVKLGSYIGDSTKSFFTTLYSLRGLAKENSELKNKVTDLQAQLATAESDVRDNQVLRQELGFVKNSKLNLQPCEVLSANPLNLTDTLVLNCGSTEGVLEGQAVMAQGHVVAKIIYTSKTISTALLVNSSKFLIDARISNTGQIAVVQGSFNSGLFVDQMPQSAILQKGNLIVTAGINPLIPKDLLIGEVGEITSAPGDLFKKASLLSPVDFKNLQFVYVIK